MSEQDRQQFEAIAALERFVVENDDLLTLEERVGRFNIFDALGIARLEIRHSNFLAWLLDPAESHGHGSLFLKAVLMDLLKQTPPQIRPISPIELDGEELRGVEVRREWRNIDILIKCDQPRFVIAIENKIDSGEHSDQLQRYEDTIARDCSDRKAMFVFLTPDASEASDDEWVSYSYAELHDVLSRIQRSSAGAIGNDVAAFLDHYLRLIGSRFMDDPEIDELCKRIYQNHRQAIDLIVDRVVSPAAGAIEAIATAFKTDDGWEIVRQTGRVVSLFPKAWRPILPSIGRRKMFDPVCWIVVDVNVGRRQCHTSVRVWPTTDSELRRHAIARLIQDPKEFRLKSMFRDLSRIGDDWATLGRETVGAWDEDEGPDIETLVPKVIETIDRRLKDLAGVPDALRPIFEEWKKAKSDSAQR